MRTLPRLLAVALLLSAPSAAPTDDARALKPIVTKGDTWTFRSVNHLKVELETVTVTFVNEAADSILADVDRRPEGTTGNSAVSNGTWTTDWNPKISTLPSSGTGTVLRPHGGFFKFPMKVGDTYETEYEITTATRDGPGAAFRVKRKVKVTRWEEVTVRAGTFKAMAIESEATVEQAGSGKSWRQVASYWYAPEVRRNVKFIQRYWPNDLEVELVSYKLADVQ